MPPAAFRGTRTYVHSTDLYEEIMTGAGVAGLAPEGAVDLRIRAVITHRPRYLFGSEPSPDTASAPATCVLHAAGVPVHITVTETDEPVSGRKPYDEGPAARHSRIEGRTARLDGETGLRPIEAVTALAVHLHKAALPPPDQRRWMLAQLATVRPLAAGDARRLTLVIERVVGGTMTRTRIEAADGVIGTMMFMLSRG